MNGYNKTVLINGSSMSGENIINIPDGCVALGIVVKNQPGNIVTIDQIFDVDWINNITTAVGVDINDIFTIISNKIKITSTQNIKIYIVAYY